jgi:general nucleoside transport system permease protein
VGDTRLPPSAEDDPDASPTRTAAPPDEVAEPDSPAAVDELFATPQRTRRSRTVLLPALAVLTALALGGLLIIFTNQEALQAWAGFFRDPIRALSTSWTVVWAAYYALFSGALGSPSEIVRAIGSGDLAQFRSSLAPISETVVTATPLILVGLSVAIGFRAGLFNIGGEGQMNIGALVASAAGFSFPGLPGPIHLVLVLVAGFVGGALWGAIPGFLKAKTGAHEVITTIMLNFVAVSLVLYMLSTHFYGQQAEPVAKPVKVSYPHLFGSSLRIHFGIFVALAVAAAVAWLLNRTTVGFRFRAVGANPAAARAAGMSPSRTIIVVMTLAGGIAGLAGSNQLLSVTPSLLPGFASGIGFDGIAIALLGRARPAGVVAAAFLFGALRAGGRTMQVVTQVPSDIITVIQALVIVFVAAPALVRAIYRVKARGVTGRDTFAKGWGA